MQTTIDAAGRIVVPKSLRDELGLTPGSTIDISRYGAGLTLIPGGRTAQVIEKDGRQVISGTTRLTDEMVFALIDAGRK